MNKRSMGCGALSWLLALALPVATAAAQDGGDGAPIPAGADGGVMAGAGGFGGFPGMDPSFQDLRVVNAGAGIPVGGGVLIQSGPGTPPIIEVADSATPNTTLGGTLTQLDFTHYWVWVPTIPLTAGTSYTVRLSSPDLGITGVIDTFTVIAAITIARPTINTEPSVSSVSATNSFACCRSLQGGFLGDSSCFPAEQVRSVRLDPGFTTADPAVLLNQFVFRMGAGPGSAKSAELYAWSSLSQIWFGTQADEYCFELEAVDIVARTVFTYEDLEGCAEHGDLADLGVVEIDPGPTALDRLVCQAPPTQYEDEWCELNEDPCADDAMATACGLYGFVCRGEPLPQDPFSTMGGFGGMFGTAGVGPIGGIGGNGGAGSGGTTAGDGGASGMSDDEEDLNAPSEPDGGGDCSVVDLAPARSAESMLAWSMAFAALVLVTRRRR